MHASISLAAKCSLEIVVISSTAKASRPYYLALSKQLTFSAFFRFFAVADLVAVCAFNDYIDCRVLSASICHGAVSAGRPDLGLHLPMSCVLP